MKRTLALVALAVLPSTAPAGIGVETYGTAAPPRWVGGGLYKVWPVPYRSDLFADVTSITTIIGGERITFSSPVSVRAIGTGWATWSHGYTGNVYYTNGATRLTMTLAHGIPAIQFYAEPNPFGVFQMTATGSDGSSSISSRQFPDGAGGAVGWCFYGTDYMHVASVQISADVDFAIGEFATGVVDPAPATLGVLGFAALFAGRRR